MKVRTEVVDPTDVRSKVTCAAQALWAATWDVSSVNEETDPENAHVVADCVAEFGSWRERLDKGIAALTAFYQIWYGEKGKLLIEKYFDAKYRSMFQDDDHPQSRRFTEARQELVALHGGYIVDDYCIRKLGDALAPGEFSLFAFDAA